MKLGMSAISPVLDHLLREFTDFVQKQQKMLSQEEALIAAKHIPSLLGDKASITARRSHGGEGLQPCG